MNDKDFPNKEKLLEAYSNIIEPSYDQQVKRLYKVMLFNIVAIILLIMQRFVKSPYLILAVAVIIFVILAVVVMRVIKLSILSHRIKQLPNGYKTVYEMYLKYINLLQTHGTELFKSRLLSNYLGKASVILLQIHDRDYKNITYKEYKKLDLYWNKIMKILRQQQFEASRARHK